MVSLRQVKAYLCNQECLPNLHNLDRVYSSKQDRDNLHILVNKAHLQVNLASHNNLVKYLLIQGKLDSYLNLARLVCQPNQSRLDNLNLAHLGYQHKGFHRNPATLDSLHNHHKGFYLSPAFLRNLVFLNNLVLGPKVHTSRCPVCRTCHHPWPSKDSFPMLLLSLDMERHLGHLLVQPFLACHPFHHKAMGNNIKDNHQATRHSTNLHSQHNSQATQVSSINHHRKP